MTLRIDPSSSPESPEGLVLDNGGMKDCLSSAPNLVFTLLKRYLHPHTFSRLAVTNVALYGKCRWQKRSVIRDKFYQHHYHEVEALREKINQYIQSKVNFITHLIEERERTPQMIRSHVLQHALPRFILMLSVIMIISSVNCFYKGAMCYAGSFSGVDDKDQSELAGLLGSVTFTLSALLSMVAIAYNIYYRKSSSIQSLPGYCLFPTIPSRNKLSHSTSQSIRVINECEALREFLFKVQKAMMPVYDMDEKASMPGVPYSMRTIFPYERCRNYILNGRDVYFWFTTVQRFKTAFNRIPALALMRYQFDLAKEKLFPSARPVTLGRLEEREASERETTPLLLKRKVR